MIKLSLAALAFFYVLCSAIIVLMIWIISGYRRTRRFTGKDISYIWKCSVCSHEYIDSKHDDVSACPLCGSYNKKEPKIF